MSFADENDDILQPTKQVGLPIGSGSCRIRLDADLDASELCCFCRLCLGRNISDVSRWIDTSFYWSDVSDSGSVDVLENTYFILRYPGCREGNVDSKHGISYDTR